MTSTQHDTPAEPRQEASAGIRTRPVWEKAVVGAILALYVLIALAFSTGPLFEGPDELQHLRMVRFILTNHDLPTLDHLAGFESHQPPVYYVMIAPFKALMDDSDLPAFARAQNPFYSGFDHEYTGNYNKNLYLHTPAEAFPYDRSPVALTLHLLRLTSILFGLATVLAGYRIFGELWPARPDLRVAALGIMCFWPIGVYFAGLVNNDLAVDLFSTIALLLVLYQLRQGPNWGRSALLGAVLGLAALSKINAIYLALPVGAAFLTDRRAWFHAPLTLLTMVVVAGWWFVRNLFVTGELTGIRLFQYQVPEAAVLPGQQNWGHWWPQMVNTYNTMWARFGVESIPVPGLLQAGYSLLLVVSIAGGLWAVVRFARSRPGWLSLGARQWIVVGLFSFSWFAAEAHAVYVGNIADHGHLYLAGLAGFAACIAVGLDAWTPARFRLRMALSEILVALFVVLVCLFGVFFSAYRPLAAAPRIDHPVGYKFGDVAVLTGVETPEVRARPGDVVNILIDWRALGQGNDHTITFLHSVGSEIVNRSSIPGSGNFNGKQWRSADTWAERYPVTIPEDAEIQRVYPLTAGLWDSKADEPLPVVDGGGAPVDTPVIGRLVISGPIQNLSPDYRFGDVIGLKQPAVTRGGGNAKICLRWISLRPVAVDYQVFIHVLDGAGTLLAQADAQPKSGNYPTSAWTPGETIDDCVALAVPSQAGTHWRVALGLYDLATGARLPVTGLQGEIVPESQVIVQP